MMGGIIQIVLGLFLWKVVPGWIEYGSASVCDFIRLLFNIVGVILTIMGVIRVLGNLLSF